jgi:glycosyltransferase involved in cell wall biosynthesis
VEKLISVVIPAKDEEASIAGCIESVFAALEGLKSFEIILLG